MKWGVVDKSLVVCNSEARVRAPRGRGGQLWHAIRVIPTASTDRARAATADSVLTSPDRHGPAATTVAFDAPVHPRLPHSVALTIQC